MEVKNVERLLKDIFNRRETKIVTHAIITARTDIPPPNLIDEEKDFFEAMVNTLKMERDKVLNLLFKKTKEDFETVKLKEDIEEFVGIDLKKYGPFKKGQVVKIPKENVELLKKVGKAKSVK